MKVLIIVTLLLAFFLGGCGNMRNNNTAGESMAMQGIAFQEIAHYDIEWDLIEFAIDLKEIDFLNAINSIKSSQYAKDVAIAIIEEYHENGRFLEFELLSILHSKDDNIWRFDYGVDQRDKNPEDLIDCGGLYIIIDGNTGTPITAWIDE